MQKKINFDFSNILNKSNRTSIIILIISILGIFLSVYLWSFQVIDRVIPCTDNGCEHVLTSEYSKMLGVPLSTYGFFYYCLLTLLAFERIFIKHKLIDNILYLSIGWGLLYSLYLRYLEFTKIGSVCMWCWISVVLVVMLVGVVAYELYTRSHTKTLKVTQKPQ